MGWEEIGGEGNASYFLLTDILTFPGGGIVTKAKP